MVERPSRYQPPDNRARVREVLMRDWDPIGVAGEPAAADEYDSYADKAWMMLMAGRPAETIAAYLREVATILMGLPQTPELTARCDRAARALVAPRPELETH